MYHRAKFCRNESNDCWDITIFRFFKTAAGRHIPFVCRIPDHPQSIFGHFGGLYWCAKSRWNPCSSCNNMKVWIFCAFGLKMPILTPPKLKFWGLDQQNGEMYQRTPKKHILAWKDVITHMTYQSSKSVHREMRARVKNTPLKPMGTKNPEIPPSPWGTWTPF